MYKVKVETLSCMSCVRNIEDVLKESDPKIELQANIPEKLLTIETELSARQVKSLIEEAGYSVNGSESKWE